MKLRHALIAAALVTIVALVWRAELWTVSRPGDVARPLAPLEQPRAPVAVDVTLPAVPVGSEHLASGRGALLVHYWAPWERHGRRQIADLDSLRRLPGLEGLRVVVVTFDPFPSVARFVARERLRLSVLLDHRRELQIHLPCPSVPFTYVLDARGAVTTAQAGEIDWLSPATREALMRVLAPPDSLPSDDAVRRQPIQLGAAEPEHV